MRLNFDASCIGIEIDPTNCYELTGFTEHDLIALSGVFGYTHDFEVTRFEGIYPNLRIVIESNALTLAIEIQIGEGIIQNELIICHNPGEGIGLKVFCAQTDAAIDGGFNQIRCLAIGSYEAIKKLNGYITWGKLGFTIDDYFLEKFLTLLEKHNRKEKTLSQLLATEEGEKFWMENGISWPGKFELYVGSESQMILENYKRKKGLL